MKGRVRVSVVRWLGVMMIASGLACTAQDPPSAALPDVCSDISRQALRPAERKFVGLAASYAADGTLRAQEEAIAASMALRREVAWETVRKVLEPVPLAVDLPQSDVTHIPAWQTWYDEEDLRRVFHRLYTALPVEDKQKRTRFSDEDLDETFLWNVNVVDELANWPEERYLEHLEAIDTDAEAAGIGGVSRVVYNPSAARHLLASYPEVLACRDHGAPPAQEIGALVEVPVTRQPVSSAPCGEASVGSYALLEGERLWVEIEDEGAGTLVVSTEAEACTTTALDGPCEVEGPATVEVTVVAKETPVDAMVDVRRRSNDEPDWAGCLNGPFPLDAAVVKVDYRRSDFNFTMPRYDTSAEALAERLTGDVSWDVPDGEVDPPASDIYTITVPAGGTFRLAALHVMTKELDHWSWTSLWWSDTPDLDFGSDRPSTIDDVTGPWSNYKMCAVTAFEEHDPAPGTSFDPSLADALDVADDGLSWCSNPYVELGHGNAGTNCIGCHQHGGSEIISEEILLLDTLGRAQVRNNFPADYSWATSAGDDLTHLFASEEAYHLGAR